MIIAVRTPVGTKRVEVPDGSTVRSIYESLKNMGVNVEGTYLSISPRDPPMKPELTISQSGIKHGDMLLLISVQSTTNSSNNNNNNSSSSSNNNNNNTVSSPASSHSSSNSSSVSSGKSLSCKHAPGDKCVFCSDSLGEKKCTHPESATCPNCQDKKFTGKKLKWLCNHPPGGKCSNCLRVPKKVSYKCTHGPSAVCSNCIDKVTNSNSSGDVNSGNSGASSPAGDRSSAPSSPPNLDANNNNYVEKQSPFANKQKPAAAPATKCLHGANAKCTNCLPKDDPNDTEPPKRRCKNHGIHGSCIECIEWRESLKMKLKSQDAAHCPGAAIAVTPANEFQHYVSSRKFEEQRIGFLYGNFLQDGSVSVDVIYEPPQKGDKKSVTLLEDKSIDKIESLASLLGMTRVGWIFSHPSRKYVMSSSEILQAANYQNKFGNSFVTLILSVNSEGNSNLEAFQVSDQAMKLEKTGEFQSNQSEPTICKLKSPVLVEGSETLNADNNFFIVTVPVKAREDKPVLNCVFPVNNRNPPTSDSDLASYKIDNQDQSKLTFFSDFHFLVYLLMHGIFDLNTDLPLICDNVRSRTSNSLDIYYELIEAHVGELIGHDH
ncbi:nuclear protein localization 4 [Heterostelium album PN500]|uniref:Nuclear protein localization 4 n=1 Tax=Heterostelium pallidum (strain ATCC 26659 / Pp 5 / PN500) TaxID=670386 RepID=D3B583_HETP5|nr:nuclear protein localization 4 [Heterostelium album PN500]EFA83448.1 nuclear protein localization 4 [Heterostelium album PN500]|eukprot:XP_020435565.1 nuclear protein localization 4 [Heterostelium album PN500]